MFIYIFIFSFTLYYLYILKKRSTLPPGPFPLHILGNLPQFGYYIMRTGSTVKAMHIFKQQYGDIFTIWIGPLPTVHIASLERAHDLMIKKGNTFADRWSPFVFQYKRGEQGIVLSNGENWMYQRRFTLQTLRNFGVGRNLIEDRIMMEFDLRSAELDKNIKNDSKHVTEIRKFVDLLVGSIINRMLFSVRFEKHNQEEFFVLKKKLDDATANLSLIDLFIPEWIMSIPIIKTRYETMLKSVDDLKDFIANQVNERTEAIRKGDHIIVDEGTDYVDAYLKKIEMEQDNPNSYFNEEALVTNLMDLWNAGLETTSTTLVFGFTYFLNHPEIAQKAREEIHRVTHGNRHLSLKDRSETPYFHATTLEIQRHANLLAINLFRQALERTQIDNYIVEPGVPITAEIALIMTEEKYFEDSDKFDPERFSKKDKLEQHIIPFGIGKRACPGESLARAEIYLLLGNLLSKYDFQPVGDLPPMKGICPEAMFNIPANFDMRFVPISSVM